MLHIGNGTRKKDKDGKINIPNKMIIPYIDESTSLNALTKAMFENICTYADNLHLMMRIAILTPKNDYVDQIYKSLIIQLPIDTIT